MGLARRGAAAFLLALCATRLPLLSATMRRTSPRIRAAPAGEKRFSFATKEDHVTLYHENGASSVFVGAVNKLYFFDFNTSKGYEEPFNVTVSKCENPEHAKNYLTLVVNYKGKLMVCGTNACSPTCWNWVDGKKEQGISAVGLAPYFLKQNSFVLFYGDNIYSAINRNGGKVIRFRRVRGPWDLYLADSLWQDPMLIQGAIIKNEEAYKDKIYLFFQEKNPEWSRKTEAPKRISRVAQLCAGDGGGTGALSSSKWSTFLKSTIHCLDPVTDRHFHLIQDAFVVHSDNWTETKIYGLFSNEWGYSAVCVYSVGNITRIFETSPLVGFTGGLPALRPGQCLRGGRETPTYTYQVANNHPETEQKVKQEDILFHNKHHYKKVLVHSVQAADGKLYNVLFLATGNGTIHKIAKLPDGGTINILEIQPFQVPAAIQSMILDSTKNVLLVASENEVVELPTAMCEVYKDNCESCVLSRDPYCGWIDGKCTSVYTTRASLQSLSLEVPQEICASSPHSDLKGNINFPDKAGKSCESLPLSSRYYLNCSLESHHATYTWVRDNKTVTRCDPGTDSCTLFIDRISDDSYGRYSCVSQEGWFKQTLVTQCLTKLSSDQGPLPPDAKTETYAKPSDEQNSFWTELKTYSQMNGPDSRATTASFSFWLCLLHIVGFFSLLN